MAVGKLVTDKLDTIYINSFKFRNGICKVKTEDNRKLEIPINGVRDVYGALIEYEVPENSNHIKRFYITK